MLATIFVSQGVPMLTAGDEIGRSQLGNNNAYCQDSTLTWIDWQAGDVTQDAFTAACAALRRAYPALRRTQWFDGHATPCGDLDVAWLGPDGVPLAPHHWNDFDQRAFAMLIGRERAGDVALLVYFNAAADGVACRLPAAPHTAWSLLLDSSAEAGLPDTATLALPARSVVVLASAPTALTP